MAATAEGRRRTRAAAASAAKTATREAAASWGALAGDVADAAAAIVAEGEARAAFLADSDARIEACRDRARAALADLAAAGLGLGAVAALTGIPAAELAAMGRAGRPRAARPARAGAGDDVVSDGDVVGVDVNVDVAGGSASGGGSW
jgi:hypothetical protein